MQGWAEAQGAAPAPSRPVERPSVLLVRSPQDGRLAIPLDEVARLEEFPLSRLEHVGGRLVVQHRGRILPLIDVAASLNGAGQQENNGDAEATVQVVVCGRQQSPVGLIVGQILDIVEQDSDVRSEASRPGVQYMTVIQGHVTEMLDVDALLQNGTGGRHG
jgi:two-component system chemotaxis sensor kinase CheA